MSRPCMLFVGDDRATTLSIAAWMRPYFHVMIAADATEALRLVDEGHGADLLVTDLDGLRVHAVELLAALRERGHRLARRAIVYTSDPLRAHERLAGAGVRAVVADKSEGLVSLRRAALQMRTGRERLAG